MSGMSLAESVKAAFDAQAAPATEETKVEEKAPETKTEVKTEEKPAEEAKVEEPVVETNHTPEEIQRALQIYETLTDPSTQTDAIKFLAEKAGLIKAAGGTTHEAVETITDILKAELGEDNAFLADKLGPAIEKILNKTIQPKISKVEFDRRVADVSNEVNSTYSKLAKEFSDFESLDAKMTEMMQVIQPGPKTSMEEYLRTLYRLVGGKGQEAQAKSSSSNSSAAKTGADNKTESAKKTQEVVEKIKKNAEEAKKQVSSDVDEATIQRGKQRPTAREAVLAALNEITGKGQN